MKCCGLQVHLSSFTTTHAPMQHPISDTLSLSFSHSLTVIFLSFSLFSLSVSLSFALSLSVCMSFSLSLLVCPSLFHSQFLSLSACLSFSLSVCLSVCLLLCRWSSVCSPIIHCVLISICHLILWIMTPRLL